MFGESDVQSLANSLYDELSFAGGASRQRDQQAMYGSAASHAADRTPAAAWNADIAPSAPRKAVQGYWSFVGSRLTAANIMQPEDTGSPRQEAVPHEAAAQQAPKVPRRSGQRSRERVHDMLVAAFPEPQPSPESFAGLRGNLGALVMGALVKESEAENEPVGGLVHGPPAAEVDTGTTAAAMAEVASEPASALQPPASGIGMAVEQSPTRDSPAAVRTHETEALQAAQASAVTSADAKPGTQGKQGGSAGAEDAAASFGVGSVWGMQELGHYEDEPPGGEDAPQGDSSLRALLLAADSGGPALGGALSSVALAEAEVLGPGAEEEIAAALAQAVWGERRSAGAAPKMAEAAAGAVPDALEAAGAGAEQEGKVEEVLQPAAAAAFAAAAPHAAVSAAGWAPWASWAGNALAIAACTIALWGCIGIIAHYESMTVRPPPPA